MAQDLIQGELPFPLQSKGSARLQDLRGYFDNHFYDIRQPLRDKMEFLQSLLDLLALDKDLARRVAVENELGAWLAYTETTLARAARSKK